MFRVLKVVATASVIALSPLSVGLAAEADAAPVVPKAPLRACAGGEPNASDAFTAATAGFVQLRYSPSHECAWGRIVGAPAGADIYVNLDYGNGNVDYQI